MMRLGLAAGAAASLLLASVATAAPIIVAQHAEPSQPDIERPPPAAFDRSKPDVEPQASPHHDASAPDLEPRSAPHHDPSAPDLAQKPPPKSEPSRPDLDDPTRH